MRVSWGVAPGWDGDAPLARRTGIGYRMSELVGSMYWVVRKYRGVGPVLAKFFEVAQPPSAKFAAGHHSLSHAKRGFRVALRFLVPKLRASERSIAGEAVLRGRGKEDGASVSSTRTCATQPAQRSCPAASAFRSPQLRNEGRKSRRHPDRSFAWGESGGRSPLTVAPRRLRRRREA